MKILYCVPALYNPGGMERIITEKINCLCNTEGLEIFVVTTDQRDEPLFFEMNKKVTMIYLDLNFNELYALSLLKKFFYTKQKLKEYRSLLKKIITEKQIDICISTGGKELEFFSDMSVKCKKILEIHYSKNFRKQFLVARKNNLLYNFLGSIRTAQLVMQTKSLDAVVVLTKKDEKEWKTTNKNIFQIYNFCSFKVEGALAETDRKRAIAIGKLDPQKGFDMLIDAWAEKKESLKDWDLDIFGQGEWQQMLQQKIDDYGLQNKVTLRGVTTNVKQELLASSAFLFSSRYEGFALVFIEAMECGLPILSFDCPEGPSELIENNDIGILIQANNVKKFADGLAIITANGEMRHNMGILSKKKAQNFSKEIIMQQWVKLFQNVLKQRDVKLSSTLQNMIPE